MHEAMTLGTRRAPPGSPDELTNECLSCGLPTHRYRAFSDGSRYSPRYCTHCEAVAIDAMEADRREREGL
jgi:hypothetical protein